MVLDQHDRCVLIPEGDMGNVQARSSDISANATQVCCCTMLKRESDVSLKMFNALNLQYDVDTCVSMVSVAGCRTTEDS